MKPTVDVMRNVILSYHSIQDARNLRHVCSDGCYGATGASLTLYSVFSNCSATVTVSPSGPIKLFKGGTPAMSGVLARFPWLLPVRNSFASYGASAVTRTRGRGHVAEVKKPIFIGFSGSQSGFPKKPFSPLMSTCAVSSKHKDAEHRPQRGLDN